MNSDIITDARRTVSIKETVHFMNSDIIITSARSWIGTSFKHQGRLKKTDRHDGGVDCIGLIVGVARELDICDADGVPLHTYDRADYGRLPSKNRLEQALIARLVPLAEPEPGAVALFNLRHYGRHVGILSHCKRRGDTLIHAHTQAGKVEETRLTPFWRDAICGCYAFPGYDAEDTP